MGAEPEVRAEAPSARYVEESRRLGMSIAFLLPLLILYHFGIVQSQSSVRSMAELWMVRAISWMGIPGAQILNLVLIIAFVVALWKLGQRGAACFAFFLIMLLESTIYAFVMFQGVKVLTVLIQREVTGFLALNAATWAPLLLSLGAGVYEELLFRFLLIGGVALLFQKVFLWGRLPSVVLAVIISSVVFSAMHYVGAFGEPLDAFSFLFRTIAGAVLGIVFVARGLGIAAWTHAIYNAMVFFTTQ